MTLKEWLDRQGLNCTEFAERTGLDQSTIWRIAEGRVLPRRSTMHTIQVATHGQVTAADLAILTSCTPQATSDAA